MRLGFFLAEAFGSMRRNWVMAMAAVITVFISTAILGAVLVTRDNLNQGATSLKNRVMIEVFVKDEATDEQKAALEQKINSIPEIKQADFITKEQALERFRKRFGERIVQNLPINPLPASWEIQVKDANQVDAVQLERVEQVQVVVDEVVDGVPVLVRVGLPETQKVWRDHVVAVGQLRDQLAEHERTRRKAVKQHDHRR